MMYWWQWNVINFFCLVAAIILGLDSVCKWRTEIEFKLNSSCLWLYVGRNILELVLWLFVWFHIWTSNVLSILPDWVSALVFECKELQKLKIGCNCYIYECACGVLFVIVCHALVMVWIFGFIILDRKFCFGWMHEFAALSY